MTVAYNLDVSSSTWISITRVLLRWRGSVWKAVISELIFWFIIYAGLNYCIRNYLNENQIEHFRECRELLKNCLPRIPLSLLLGFFVSMVFTRWSEIFKRIGFIDNLALSLAAIITDNSHETKMLRRRIIRYAVLTQTLVFRDISLGVRKRFPDMDSIINSGLMTDEEFELFEAKSTRNSKYWIPIQWAMKLIWKAKNSGKITNDVITFNLTERLREFRTDLQMLCCYDWAPIPLAFPQIVFLTVRTYFFINVIVQQSIDQEFMIPFMTIIETLLLMGWVKVAELMLNPLGTDDDDFECNYVIDRNLSLGFEIVDGIELAPCTDSDVFATMQSPLPLDHNPFSRKKVTGYIGSVADFNVLYMEKEDDSDQEVVDEPKKPSVSLKHRKISKRASTMSELSTVMEESNMFDTDVVIDECVNPAVAVDHLKLK